MGHMAVGDDDRASMRPVFWWLLLVVLCQFHLAEVAVVVAMMTMPCHDDDVPRA